MVSETLGVNKVKFIQYYDADDYDGIIACCVVAYSVQKRGKLVDCEYILYHPNYKKHKEIPIVNTVFDRIEPLPDAVNKIVENLPEHCRHIKDNQRELSCWRKFLCWLYTAGTVISTDYDFLCCGSIKEVVPPKGYIIAGRQANNGRITTVLNGGLLAKNNDFDTTDAGDIMLEALLDKDAYRISQKNWNWIDEAATWHYFHKRGIKGLHTVDSRFNMKALWHIKTGRSIEYNDVRFLHYGGENKPWLECKPEYNQIKKLWLDVRNEMLQSVMPSN